jgi:TRAP-type mannitol/chloroaromatic compound transport system substrate-binding protein
MTVFNRRQCVFGLAAVLAGCQPDAEFEKKPEIIWRLVTAWPKRFPGLGQAAEMLARVVKVLSSGRFQIEVDGAPQLSSASAKPTVFSQVSQNHAQMGHAAAYYWQAQIPAASFFTAVPFGLTAQQMNSWLQFAGGMTLWKSLYRPFNVLPFQGGNTGAQMAGWFKKELHHLGDIQGLKMRIPGIGARVWQQLGGEPIELAGDEILPALQQGQIDAAEWMGPYGDLAFGLHKAASFYYYPGWQEPSTNLEFLVNLSAYEALSAQYQQILEQATLMINQAVLDECTARNHASLEELVDMHQVQVKPLPAEMLQALRRESEKVVQQIAHTDPQAERIYQSFKSFQVHTLAYQQLAEIDLFAKN